MAPPTSGSCQAAGSRRSTADSREREDTARAAADRRTSWPASTTSLQVASQRMASCALANGHCGRLDGHCSASKGCLARVVHRLAERRWREKLGLFACEGEDLVAAATAEPVELLVAGENVSTGAARRGLDGAAPAAGDRDLPAGRPARRRAAAGGAGALGGRGPGERRDPDPDGRGLRGVGRAVGGLCRPDRTEGAPCLGRRDLERPARLAS